MYYDINMCVYAALHVKSITSVVLKLELIAFSYLSRPTVAWTTENLHEHFHEFFYYRIWIRIIIALLTCIFILALIRKTTPNRTNIIINIVCQCKLGP